MTCAAVHLSFLAASIILLLQVPPAATLATRTEQPSGAVGIVTAPGWPPMEGDGAAVPMEERDDEDAEEEEEEQQAKDEEEQQARDEEEEDEDTEDEEDLGIPGRPVAEDHDDRAEEDPDSTSRRLSWERRMRRRDQQPRELADAFDGEDARQRGLWMPDRRIRRSSGKRRAHSAIAVGVLSSRRRRRRSKKKSSSRRRRAPAAPAQPTGGRQGTCVGTHLLDRRADGGVMECREHCANYHEGLCSHFSFCPETKPTCEGEHRNQCEMYSSCDHVSVYPVFFDYTSYALRPPTDAAGMPLLDASVVSNGGMLLQPTNFGGLTGGGMPLLSPSMARASAPPPMLAPTTVGAGAPPPMLVPSTLGASMGPPPMLAPTTLGSAPPPMLAPTTLGSGAAGPSSQTGGFDGPPVLPPSSRRRRRNR